jgi:ABC-type transport system involved in multi-copper enzyme maturation permease subunit
VAEAHLTGFLGYREDTSRRSGSWRGIVAVARASLRMVFRRKMFWALYAFSLLIFLFYLFGQYLTVYIENRVSEAMVRQGGVFGRMFNPQELSKVLTSSLHMNGSADTYGDFIWTEGYIVIVIMALVGSLLIGNDFQHNSLPFYLSKPIGKFHYLLGKALAAGGITAIMTLIPCLCLFLEYGFIEDWSYYWTEWRLFLGVVGYGSLVVVTLSSMILAVSAWLRRTGPVILVWISLFVLSRFIQRWLVDGLGLSPSWRLIDTWNNLYLTAMWLFDYDHAKIRPTNQAQPPYGQAVVVVSLTILVCILSLRNRVRAVEVVR